MVPDDTVERVTVREPVGDDAIGGDIPVTGPAGVEQTPESTLATAPIETGESADAETLARSGPLPTPANRADRSVTQEQVISVVPDDTVERVTIREPVGDDAIGGDSPVTGPAGVEQTPESTLATAPIATGEVSGCRDPGSVRSAPHSGQSRRSVRDPGSRSSRWCRTTPSSASRFANPSAMTPSGAIFPSPAPVPSPVPLVSDRRRESTLATAPIETGESAGVETLARSGPLPTPANRADQSVTQEQVISVVPDDTVERVTVREPVGDDAIGGDIPVTGPGPVTGPAGVEQTPESTLATAPIETGESAGVETLARSGPLPTPANRADRSVTQEQVISVVPDDTVERVTVREPVGDDAIGGDIPVTGPAGVGQTPESTLATAPIETGESADAETLARSGPLPTPANRADRSVTQEQVISVVPDDTVERVTVREPDGDDAIGGDIPVTGPAGVEQTPESTLATAPIETGESAGVETLARSGPLPTPANRADQSVTQEQVISVVPDDTVARVTVREPDGDDAIGGDIPVTGPGPVTGPAAVGQKLAGTHATGAEQTGTEQTGTDEPANLEALTRSGPLPAPTNRADQSVIQERVISVVPDDTVERVTVREPGGDDAIGGDAPVTGPRRWRTEAGEHPRDRDRTDRGRADRG